MSISRQRKGKIAEDMAAKFMMALGYQVVACNWTHQKMEIDLIVENDQVLVFVEVKARQNKNYGDLHESLKEPQILRILEAAEHYIEKTQCNKEIRFDLITVLDPENQAKIDHYPEAFSPY